MQQAAQSVAGQLKNSIITAYVSVLTESTDLLKTSLRVSEKGKKLQ